MSSIWTPNCKYTITINGITADDGEAGAATGAMSAPFEWSFYSMFKPLWGNIDIIKMDLRSHIGDTEDHIIYAYMYLASMEAWRAMDRNPDIQAPNPSLTLDELLAEGYDRDLIAYIECYVRWKTQYDLLGDAIAKAAATNGLAKVLGDFSVKYGGDPGKIAAALDQVIKPRMEECFYQLAGRFLSKGSPKCAIRGSTEVAASQTLEARRMMRPGFNQNRNWDWSPPRGRR